MNGMLVFLELLKYTVPAIIVLIASALLVNRFLHRDEQEKRLDLLRETRHTTLRLRLQAYERLTLFIERIHPRQLVPRLYQPGMTVADLHAVLVYAIRSEFEHNLSQQIYVSREAWDLVRNTKEQELNVLNTLAQQLNPDDSGKELHKRIVDHVLTTEGDLPTDMALAFLNEEAKSILQ